MTRTQKALAALIIKIEPIKRGFASMSTDARIDAGSKIWDGINRIAEKHKLSRTALLDAYAKSQQ